MFPWKLSCEGSSGNFPEEGATAPRFPSRLGHEEKGEERLTGGGSSISPIFQHLPPLGEAEVGAWGPGSRGNVSGTLGLWEAGQGQSLGGT